MNYPALLPPLLMAIFGCATLMLDAALPAGNRVFARRMFFSLNAAGQLLILWAFARQWALLQSNGPLVAVQGAVLVDGLSIFTNAIVWLAIVVLFLISYRYLDEVHEQRAEYYALAVFAQCGMYFMASGVDLVSIFVGLELTAISFYILVGFTRADRRSNEAALKYLLLGAVSSGFVLYGFSLLYGITGQTQLHEITHVLDEGSGSPVLWAAIVAITVGLLFKVSAAPFHTWAPDAYDGAPTPITGYLSVASKVASFAVLLRILPGALHEAADVWQPLLSAAAVLSLTFGSIAAITQDRVKRLFAYSGIAHAGYALLGIIAGALEAVYVYLFVYALMNLGAFAVLTSLRRRGIAGESVSDLRGLSRAHPVHAGLFAILLLSLAGIPPSAGFIGKYYIFAALIRTGHIALAVIASAYVVVSLYFYFRLVREMYLEPLEMSEPMAPSFGVRLALAATAALTLIVGVFPEPALNVLTMVNQAQ